MSLSLHLPRFQRLAQTNLQAGYQHSNLISLMRALAALEVVAAHLRAQLFPSLRTLPDPTFWYQVLAFFTGFSHQGVVVFFVLSGWLVGGSLLNKLHQPGIMLAYAIDRLTRLWTVLIPAFVLTLLISMFTGDVLPTVADFSTDNPYSFSAFVGNLLGLQTMAVPRFGGNFSLWSLANETWYYVLFPMLLLPLVAKTTLVRCGAVVLTAIAAFFLNADLMLYFAVWLMGVGFSRLRIDASPAVRRLLLLTLLCASVYFRMAGNIDRLVAGSLLQDVILSGLFLAYLSSLQFKASCMPWAIRSAKVAAFFSGFSFTLYVIHVPLLGLLRSMFPARLGHGLSPDHIADLGVMALMLVTIVALAYLFHLPFEAQTYRLRRIVKSALVWPRQQSGTHSGLA